MRLHARTLSRFLVYFFLFLPITCQIAGFYMLKISFMTIAERIRLIRQQKNISQKELAEMAEVNLKSLSRYELGTSVPPADVIKRVADALKVSTDALLSDETITIKDKELLKKFEVIQNMTGETKQALLKLIDLAIRDHKAQQAYLS